MGGSDSTDAEGMEVVMLQAVLDTNILIDHLAGRKRLKVDPREFVISTITEFELLRLPGMSEEEEQILRELVGQFDIISVNREIAQRAAKLNRSRPRTKPMDLFIAATALELEVPLVTKNSKDFKHLPDLLIQTAP